jgi:hypothetical protein
MASLAIALPIYGDADDMDARERIITTFSSSLLGLIGLTLIVPIVWVTSCDFLCVTYPPATYETSKISKTFGKNDFYNEPLLLRYARL